MREQESGFTLIELLVVILIVAILAAVAIPVFLRQRIKGYEDQVRSDLKNAATAAESHATENQGSYEDLNGVNEGNPGLLAAQGFSIPLYYTRFEIKADVSTYCIKARHDSIPGGIGPTGSWRQSTYQGSVGEPQPDPNDCP